MCTWGRAIQLPVMASMGLLQQSVHKRQIVTFPSTGKHDIGAQGGLGPRSVTRQAGICNANILCGGNSKDFLLPLVGCSSPIFDYLFYCSVHLSTDFFPQDCADRNKNALVLLTLSQGKECPKQNRFQQLSMWRSDKMAPPRTSCVCPLSSCLPSCWAQLVGMAHTTPRIVFTPPTHCQEVFQTFNMLFPGRPLISDFKHCQSCVSSCDSFLLLEK